MIPAISRCSLYIDILLAFHSEPNLVASLDREAGVDERNSADLLHCLVLVLVTRQTRTDMSSRNITLWPMSGHSAILTFACGGDERHCDRQTLSQSDRQSDRQRRTRRQRDRETQIDRETCSQPD